MLADDVLDAGAFTNGRDITIRNPAGHAPSVGGASFDYYAEATHPQSRGRGDLASCTRSSRVSVYDAIWSTTTRSRAPSSSARANSAANCGSRLAGAWPHSDSATSRTMVRWSA